MPNALIWGASGGMGRALVTELKEAGWSVYAAARSTENVPTVADAVYEFEASSEQSFEEVARFAAQEAGEINLAVFAAGTLVFQKMDKMTLDEWRLTVDSNLTGAFLAALHGLPLMPKGGHMTFIGAYVDHIRFPKFGPYTVSKAGLAELVNILRKENRRMNFTLVRPGAVDTGFWDHVSINMPDDAKEPIAIAKAIITQYDKGEGIDLDL